MAISATAVAPFVPASLVVVANVAAAVAVTPVAVADVDVAAAVAATTVVVSEIAVAMMIHVDVDAAAAEMIHCHRLEGAKGLVTIVPN